MTATVERIVRTEDAATLTEETSYNLKLTERQARVVEALLLRISDRATQDPWRALQGALPRLTAERPCVSLNGRRISACDLTITFPEEESA